VNDDHPDCTTIKPRPRRELRLGQSVRHAGPWFDDGTAGFGWNPVKLLLAVAGFCLIVGWMFAHLFHRAFISTQASASRPPPNSSGWMGNWGLFLFGASWLCRWSIESKVLLRQVNRTKQAGQKTRSAAIGGFGRQAAGIIVKFL